MNTWVKRCLTERAELREGVGEEEERKGMLAQTLYST